MPESTLFDVERATLGDAIAPRRREFAAARWCARNALERLGLPRAAVPSGDSGEPLWPAGVVGSITHCAGYRASAVARAADVRSIGIDAEPDAPLPPGVLRSIATAGDVATAAGVCADRLLFSAKEAAFKAWFPMTGRSIGFEDVAVRIDGSAFEARIGADELRGRWAVAGGLIGTAVVVPR